MEEFLINCGLSAAISTFEGKFFCQSSSELHFLYGEKKSVLMVITSFLKFVGTSVVDLFFFKWKLIEKISFTNVGLSVHNS